MTRYSTTTAQHWITLERQRERVYQHRQFQYNERAKAADEITSVRVDRGAQPVRSDMPDAFLRELADRRAETMAARITNDRQPRDVPGYVSWINAQVQALDGQPLRLIGKGTDAQQLAGLIARAQCAAWWRRQLRRAVVRLRESEGIARSEVCATRRQPYVTNDTLRRRVEQNGRNAAMLAATEIESADGQVIKLADAAAASTSNKAIRRGELMTRITGCESLADAAGHAGLFVTATAPSRFHSTLRHGGANPKWRGDFGPVQPNSPRDAQRWLCRAWARARAALDRLGVPMYGFRVAEPHHDGCPHWHLLLWTVQRHADKLVEVLRRYWLADDGAEAGAAEHRLTVKAMHPGGASGYVAKYIAKNIDDAGAVGDEGHTDEFNGEAVPMPAQADMFGGTAQRVEAWASAWGIRQFQALGQPPVTPWRELRRVEAGDVLGASHRTCRAWVAAHRNDDKRADWGAYVEAQGGLMMGRFYAVRVAEETKLHHGRYESIEKPRPVGVFDPSEPHNIVRSARREWRPKGAWRQDERRAPKAPTLTRTRFNNCTQGRQLPTRIAGRVMPRGSPLMTWKALIDADDGSSYAVPRR